MNNSCLSSQILYKFIKKPLWALILIAVLFFHLGAVCSSPRLIITVDKKCDFTSEELLKNLQANLVTGDISEAKEKIKTLDQSHFIHIMMIEKKINNKDEIRDLASFAKKLGYVRLHLNTKYKKALKIIKEVLATIPCTDADLARVDPYVIGQFYDLMIKVDRILKKHGLTYWATCGTLLGVVRHQGMVPWDDDVDIAMFEEDIPRLLALQKELSKEGLKLCFHPKYKFYKICLTNGQAILKENGERYPWSYPFVDIWPLTRLQDRVTYACDLWWDNYPNDYFLHEDLTLPLPELPFGPMSIPVPHFYMSYLSRAYENWNEVAYIGYNHQEEQIRTKIKVDLVDRSPPAYFLPSK